MTYAQGPGNLESAITGVPFVTVGAGAGYTFPLSATDASATMATAITSVTAAGVNLGKPIYVYLQGAVPWSGTLTISAAANVTIIGPGGGGIGVPSAVLLPAGYFNYTGAGGVAINMVKVVNTAGLEIVGLSFVVPSGVTNMHSIFYLDMVRTLTFYESFFYDANAATAATESHVAFICGASGKTSDTNYWLACNIIAPLAVQMGVSGDGYNFNDSVFDHCTFSATGFACDTTTNCLFKWVTGSTNIQFYQD
jgi:hypothetical protein